jgi:hypothetical protein
MERYRLDEVMSGTEETYLWVTLGFSSEVEKNDVLHIVCATEVELQDREHGMADLYLERFDQVYCCYGGADLVLATPVSVEARLNEKGRQALDFDGGGVTFDVPTALAGYEDALQILQKMSVLECGRRVHVQLGG